MFFQTGATRLLDSTTDGGKFPHAVSICRDCNVYPGLVGAPGVFGRKIETVRTRIDLKKAAILLRVSDSPIKIDIIARTL